MYIPRTVSHDLSGTFLLELSIINKFNFQVGDKVPSVDLFEKTPANKVNLASLCEGKKVVVFGVPGAFTPGCSKVTSWPLLNVPSDTKHWLFPLQILS